MLRLSTLALLLLVPSSACAQRGERAATQQGDRGPEVPDFYVRPGYRVTLAAEGLDHSRFMQFDDAGNLYVSELKAHKITRLRDADGDGFYEDAVTFLDDQQFVHGMDFHDGWLWFAPSTAVRRARDTDGDGKADEVESILEDLPGNTGHLHRPLLIGDGVFYTHVGDTGNVTDETDTDRQKIWRYDLDGSGKTLFASGLRNNEELRFRPGTTEIWGCDHGSDNFGEEYGEGGEDGQPITDAFPPDELNHYVEGAFYGHPFLVGSRVPRPEHRDRPDLLELAAKTVVPEWDFGPHWATNGFCFVSLENNHLPADHRGDMFVGCHGSWNSTKKVGYRVERVLFDEHTGKPMGAQRIVGTLAADGEEVLGRPVDCVEAPDGSILFTDDFTQRIYRIEWVGE